MASLCAHRACSELWQCACWMCSHAVCISLLHVCFDWRECYRLWWSCAGCMSMLHTVTGCHALMCDARDMRLDLCTTSHHITSPSSPSTPTCDAMQSAPETRTHAHQLHTLRDANMMLDTCVCITSCRVAAVTAITAHTSRSIASDPPFSHTTYTSHIHTHTHIRTHRTHHTHTYARAVDPAATWVSNSHNIWVRSVSRMMRMNA